MDLKTYYSRISEVEASIESPDVVIVSVDDDPIRVGVRTEVPKRIAARMIAEGKARLATPEEAERFHRSRREAIRAGVPSGIQHRSPIVPAVDRITEGPRK